ncbi:MAG: hypothetical protein IPG72_05035 [Ardenticatenales bacterium]|nr:hypothetical protein [Ardenticatenales bacterium]
MKRPSLAAAAVGVAAVLAMASLNGPPATQAAGTAPFQATLPPPAPTATNVGMPPAPTEVPQTGQVCQFIVNKVPAQVIASALANPDAVYGFNRPRNPNVAVSYPLNPRRVYLSLWNPHVHFHPMFNSLKWVAGCP